MKQILEEVMCPKCGHIQVEEHGEGDKFAWECKKCWNIIEGDKPILFDKYKVSYRVHFNGIREM